MIAIKIELLSNLLHSGNPTTRHSPSFSIDVNPNVTIRNLYIKQTSDILELQYAYQSPSYHKIKFHMILTVAQSLA